MSHKKRKIAKLMEDIIQDGPSRQLRSIPVVEDFTNPDACGGEPSQSDKKFTQTGTQTEMIDLSATPSVSASMSCSNTLATVIFNL